MEKRHQELRSRRRLGIRRRADLGVIAAYIHALSPRTQRTGQSLRKQPAGAAA
jgi:hypothetical protein